MFISASDRSLRGSIWRGTTSSTTRGHLDTSVRRTRRGRITVQRYLRGTTPLTDDLSVTRETLLRLDRDRWVDLALSDLEFAHGNIRDCVERVDVMIWGHAMVPPRPGFVWSEQRVNAARPQQGVHFAHTDLSGVALFEEAFYPWRAQRERSSRGVAGIVCVSVVVDGLRSRAGSRCRG